MIRIIIGTLIVLAGFMFKAMLNHHIAYWGLIKSWTSVLLIIGFVVICFPLLKRNKAWKVKVSNLSPGKTALHAFLAILIPIVIFVSTILLEHLGGLANEKIMSYYFSKETITAEASVVDLVQVPYFTKFGRRYEPFYLIQYSTADEIIQQGLKPQVGLSVGSKVKVKYSVSHPTMVRVE